MAINGSITRPDLSGPFEAWRRNAEQKMERTALEVTDRGARRAVLQIREAMQGAGLGRLGNALGDN